MKYERKGVFVAYLDKKAQINTNMTKRNKDHRVHLNKYVNRKSSLKHTYIILTPLNPTFILLNWGLQGYTLFFSLVLKKIVLDRQGGSNEYPQSTFWAEI